MQNFKSFKAVSQNLQADECRGCPVGEYLNVEVASTGMRLPSGSTVERIDEDFLDKKVHYAEFHILECKISTAS